MKSCGVLLLIIAMSIVQCLFLRAIEMTPTLIPAYADTAKGDAASLEFEVMGTESDLVDTTMTANSFVPYALTEEDSIRIAYNQRHLRQYIDDDITIINGARLTLMEGSDVFIREGVKIIVEDGILEIAGTRVNPVKLYSYTQDQKYWGGIRCTGVNSELIIRYAIIYNCQNTADSSDTRGGAIFASAAKNVLIENTVIFNCSAGQGGAIWIDHTPTTLTNNKFIANIAEAGSAIWLQNTTANLIGNYLHGNKSDSGTALECNDSEVSLFNCTLTDNERSAEQDAGQASHPRGIIRASSTRLKIVNSILYDKNTRKPKPQITLQDNSDCDLNSCLIRGGMDSVDNQKSKLRQTNILDADPLLADEPYFGYVLSPDSPCLNQGVAITDQNFPALDIDGDLRLDTTSRIVDIGAYEYNPVENLTIDSDITVDAVWKCRSVTVTQPIKVKSYATLTIYPGCTVRLRNKADITAQGRILSIGSAAAPVTFCNDVSPIRADIQNLNSSIDTTVVIDSVHDLGNSAALNLMAGVDISDMFGICESWWKPDSVAIAYNYYNHSFSHTVFHGLEPYQGWDTGIFVNVFDTGNAQFRDCTFRDNYRPRGNGVVAVKGEYAIFIRCLFQRNIGLQGGALWSEGNSRLIRCRFLGNKAAYGGALFAASGYTSSMYCTFAQNDATYGGAQYSSNANINMFKSTLSENTAGYGGGVYIYGEPDISFSSSIIYGNKANHKGSQIYLSTEDPIFDFNAPEKVVAVPDSSEGGYDDYRDYEEYVGEKVIRNCDIEGGDAGIGRSWENTADNDDDHPISDYYDNVDLPPHLDSAYALLPDSPLIDQGMDPQEQDYRFRDMHMQGFQGLRYDIGVEELPVLDSYVMSGIIPADTTPFTRKVILSGVVEIPAGVTITIDSLSTMIEALPQSQIILKGKLIITGSVLHPLLIQPRAEKKAWLGIAVQDNGCLQGENLLLSGCVNAQEAAIHLSDAAQLQLTNCTLTQNQNRKGSGGAISVDESSRVDVFLNQCRISGNKAKRGGALYLRGKVNARLDQCIFEGNQATQGGALFLGQDAVLRNCVLYRNKADESGGGIYVNSGVIRVQNCTITQNSAGKTGSGVYIQSDQPIAGEVGILNTIIKHNTGSEECYYREPAQQTLWISDSIIGGLKQNKALHATTSRDEDPAFKDPENADFSLQPWSVCLENGSDSAWFLGPRQAHLWRGDFIVPHFKAWDGSNYNVPGVGTSLDIGAIEYIGTPPLEISPATLEAGIVKVNQQKILSLYFKLRSNNQSILRFELPEGCSLPTDSTKTTFPIQLKTWETKEVNLVFTPTKKGTYSDVIKIFRSHNSDPVIIYLNAKVK